MKYFLSFFLVFLNLNASELHLSNKEALKQGFKPAPPLKQKFNFVNLPANNLPWPVNFVDARHTIGNSTPEYQNYGSEAYFHMGADLRVGKNAAVAAPIDGFLQGDYYTYVTDPNTGKDTKYTKPITEGGDDLYFELTITTPEQIVFEFHHVNPNNLPKNIYDLVLRGGGQVTKGEQIGFTSIWPVTRFQERYDHIHYNIISPNGTLLNSEHYSLALDDKIPPVIKNVFAIYKDKKIEVKNQKIKPSPSEIVISTYDLKGANIYPLPPVFIEASWENNQKVNWNFSESLIGANGQQPDIRDVYARNLTLTDGRTFTTQGNYQNTEFLFRLKLPEKVVGNISIVVRDGANNEKRILLETAE